jgi:putative holliday junction resolvase
MKEKYPVLAIDYGEKNFGLAISDSKGLIASPLEVLSITKNRDINHIIKEIFSISKEHGVKKILVGKPQAFTKIQEKSTKKIEKFIEKLETIMDIPIVTYDEAFSTIEAQNMLTSSGQNARSFKGKIDKIAATIFLQEFLNSKNRNNDRGE